MNLLITNDDGYMAPGIKVLADELSENHTVYVMAPAGNRSAVSQHITMFNDTEIHKISDKVYSCEGYPADCVCIGLGSDLYKVKFDGVISGINCGANLGTDIIYSGTCAAARQSVLIGVPSIACSVDPVDWEKAKNTSFYYETLAKFVNKNLKALLSLSDVREKRSFVNINAPAVPEYKGVKCGEELCLRDYQDKFLICEKDGKTVSVFSPGGGSSLKKSDVCDFNIVRDGYVCVSLVYADPVCGIVDCNNFKL